MDTCADLQPSSYSKSLCPGYTTHYIYFVGSVVWNADTSLHTCLFVFGSSDFNSITLLLALQFTGSHT